MVDPRTIGPRFKSRCPVGSRPLIETESVFDTGRGAVDVALRASVLFTPNARLWTADRNLEALAARLGVALEASGR